VADLLLVPGADHMLYPAPAGLEPEALCLLPDNVIDGYRAVAPPLAEAPGVDVLIVGGAAASGGLYATMFAVALGARSVRYVDGDARRCELAESLGAAAQYHEGPWPKGFERALITVENTGDSEGLMCTIRSTDDYGTCTPIAVDFTPTTPVPLLAMYTRGITLRLGRADSRRYLGEILHLAAAHHFDPLSIKPRIVSFDDAAEAWLQEPQIKLVLRER
jgi:alcohol dehydrogenase